MSRRLLLSRLTLALGAFLAPGAMGQEKVSPEDEQFAVQIMTEMGELWLRKPSVRDMISGFYYGLARELGIKYRAYFETEIPTEDNQLAFSIYLTALLRISHNAPKDAQAFAVRVLIERSLNAYLIQEDDYAAFLSRTTAQIVLDEKGLKGYVGIGVDLKKGTDGPVCVPFSGAQAALEGVRKGDVLLEIDGITARYMTTYEASQRLRGKPGSKVKIVVRHGDEGAETEGFEIERVKIDAVPLETRTVDNRHHLRLRTINAAAVEAVKAELTGIGPGKSIVLDLRGNPGGDYDESVRLAELFLPKGTGIVKLQTLAEIKSEVSKNPAPYVPAKLSIFHDANTGSGAELIISALAAHKPLRVRTFGVRTFGKGVSQAGVLMPGNSGILRLTYAKMYGPNNEDWDRKGIEPDEELPEEFAR